jgi:TonB family protein
MQNQAHDTFTVWTEESGRDRRNTRWAVIVAVALHALFFRLQLPETAAAERTSPKLLVFPIQTARFEPPLPREQQKMPERRVLRVPVPDPTPDDPEPLATAEEIVLSVDLRDTDLVIGLPAAPQPELPPGPHRVGGKILPPVRRHAPPPRYPEIARAARIQGEVTLEAVIDATGEVTRIRVIQGLPLGLDQAAVEAVRKWRFEPATYNGKPVPVFYNLTVYFRLT